MDGVIVEDDANDTSAEMMEHSSGHKNEIDNEDGNVKIEKECLNGLEFVIEDSEAVGIVENIEGDENVGNVETVVVHG